MSSRHSLKAFILGSSYFVLLTPFTYLGVSYHFNPVEGFSIEFVSIALPILFGLINVLYFHVKDFYPVKSLNARYWLTGLVYGLLLSSYGIFVEDLPATLFAYIIPPSLEYSPLLIAPILYGCVWRFIVKNLNHFFELE